MALFLYEPANIVNFQVDISVLLKVKDFVNV